MNRYMNLKTIIDEENVHHVNAALLLIEFIEAHFKVKNLEMTMEDSLFHNMCAEATFEELAEEAVSTAIKLQTT